MKPPTIGAFITAGVISVGALMTVTAPVVQAKPLSEGTIKSECKDAGGKYTTASSGGHRSSACAYKTTGGDRLIDWYSDGEYTETTPDERPH